MQTEQVPEITAQIDPSAAAAEPAAQVDVSHVEEYKPDIDALEQELDQYKQSKDLFDDKVGANTWQDPDTKPITVDVSNTSGVVLKHFEELFKIKVKF